MDNKARLDDMLLDVVEKFTEENEPTLENAGALLGRFAATLCAIAVAAGLTREQLVGVIYAVYTEHEQGLLPMLLSDSEAN